MERSIVSITVEDIGSVELSSFDNYAINYDVLTPCCGWSLDVGGFHAWRKVMRKVEAGMRMQLHMDGLPVLKGYIDKVEVNGDASSISVHLEGRDFLMPFVKANLHPNTVIKDLSLIDAMDKIFTQVYRTNRPAFIYDLEANRSVLARKPTKKGKQSASLQAQIQSLQPQSGEGVFEFAARLLRRHGLWMFSCADGSVAFTRPNYDQPVSYEVHRVFDAAVSYVKRARWSRDKTNVPSHVFMRGKGGAKGEGSSTVQGRAVDPTFRVWAPAYLKNDNVQTPAEAQRYATQAMMQRKCGENVYTATMKGHRDELTRAYYTIDTIAHVRDEVYGFESDMYCASCTWSRSTNETTTEIKLVPVGTIDFGMEAES